MRTLMFGLVVILAGTAMAPPKAKVTSTGKAAVADQAIYMDWARLNRQVYEQYGKKATSYFSNLEKRSKVFCKSRKLSSARLEQIVQAGVRAEWPTEDPMDVTLARKYIEEVEAARDRTMFALKMRQKIQEMEARRAPESSSGRSVSLGSYESSIRSSTARRVTAADIHVSVCGEALDGDQTCQRPVPGGGPCWWHRTTPADKTVSTLGASASSYSGSERGFGNSGGLRSHNPLVL